MEQQNYSCEGCGLESHVMYAEHESVFQVIYKIDDDHKKWSPECQRSYRELRLRGGLQQSDQPPPASPTL
jgi:hypothetical protein